MHVNEELVFGLVAPLGVDLDGVYDSMKAVLETFGFEVVKVSVSDFIKKRTTVLTTEVPKHLNSYIDTMQAAGNQLRFDSGRNDAMAACALREINDLRKARLSSGNKSTRVAYVIRQLKTPEEVKTLRSVYGDRLSVVGVFTALRGRIDWLSKQIALSRGEGTAWTKWGVEATRLINLDAEEKLDHGQKVRDTFPLSDLFITWRGIGNYDQTHDRGFQLQFDRYVSGLLGNPGFVPTTEELLMAQATIVARQSADWSRQVGAVIATREGSVVAVGRNDDPKVGGGVVASRQPVDSAIEFKRKTLEEILASLNDWLKPEEVRKGTDELAAVAVKTRLKSTRLMGIGEFGRMVHAEMAAITDAAARGVAVKGQVIFCTTFPCQNCAKHLMAAGIRALVHIEPYPKSLVREMYESEIEELPMESLVSDEFERQVSNLYANKFLLLNFMGVAPRGYERLFSMPVRKDGSGERIKWDRKTARPRLAGIWAKRDYRSAELEFSAPIVQWLKA